MDAEDDHTTVRAKAAFATWNGYVHLSLERPAVVVKAGIPSVVTFGYSRPPYMAISDGLNYRTVVRLVRVL